MRLVCLLFFCMSVMSVLQAQRATSVIPDIPKKKSDKSTFNRMFEGQPGKAALYSLVAPGAGQLYNRRYWKAPLVWAGEGYAIYNLINKLNTFNQLNNCHIALSENSIDVTSLCGTVTSVSTAFAQSQAARSDKEIAWVIVGAAHLLNVFDAFVDRHLINFDTSPDVSFNFQPTDHYAGTPATTLLQINFPLSK